MLKLISLDLDGTLLNSQKEVSEYDWQAIQYGQSRGVRFVVSTGRPKPFLTPLPRLKEIGIEYVTCLNGAVMYHMPDESVVFEHGIDLKCNGGAIKEISLLDCHLQLYCDVDMYCPENQKDSIDDLLCKEVIKNLLRHSGKPCKDVLEEIQKDHAIVYKGAVNFRTSKKDREKVIEILSRYPMLDVVSSDDYSIEFTQKGTSKGSGLVWLCNYLGIDIGDTAAIGDTENDLDIIKTAGIGIAMDNSEQIVLEHCDYRTDDNDHGGVGKAIYHFI